MLGLRPKTHPAAVRPRGRARLRLEGLELRDQPDGGMTPMPPPTTPPATTTTPPPGATPMPPAGATPPPTTPPPVYTPPATPPNQPPQIVDFDVEEIGNGRFLVTGRVVDEAPGGLTVTLRGTTSCSGTTATTGSDGSFQMVVQLRTDGTDSGYIAAQTADAQGLTSNTPYSYASPTHP